jgi:hypothetical protein
MGHIAGKEGMADKIHILEEHAHSPQKIYPPSANAIVLTAAASAWTHGTKVEIIPAGAISEDIDIHWANITSLSANGEYEVIVYKGAVASEVEIGRVPAERTSVQSQEGNQPMLTRLLKGERVSASVATSTGNADTCKIKLSYHEY